jgi:3-hydroxyisobutyrate dehydrogenase-like beta-hydroxyacid dehydrogenase
MTSITQDHSKLGFIGIGAMGSRIAGRLLKQGFQVTVFDRNAAKANALVESGGIVALLDRRVGVWRRCCSLYAHE